MRARKRSSRDLASSCRTRSRLRAKQRCERVGVIAKTARRRVLRSRALLRRSSRTISFSVVTSRAPWPRASDRELGEFARACRRGDRERRAAPGCRRRARRAWRKTSAAGRSRQMRSQAFRRSARPRPLSGVSDAVNTGLPKAAATSQRPRRRVFLARQAGSRRQTAVARRSGARNGPAGTQRPLPMPTSPSTTAIARSGSICRLCKPSSSTSTLGLTARRASHAASMRSAPTITGAVANQEQRLVADVARPCAWPD